MSRYPRFSAFCILCTLCVYASGCMEDSPPQGTVASVNGERIALHSVQALLDSRSAALGIPAAPSVAEMRLRYGRALGVLVVHALVRQELAERGLEVSQKELDDAIADIKADYAEASLEELLAEAYLREDEWRLLTRDHLAIEKFERQVLEPSIRVNLDDIRQYYKEHAKDFTMPETWEICLKTGDSKEALAAWCARLGSAATNDAATQCTTARPQETPPPWRQELGKMKAPACGKIIKEQEQWHVAALMEKIPARQPPLSEMYALVESILLEEKKIAAFDAWLNKKLAKAKIKVAPDIISSDPEKETAEAQETDRGKNSQTFGSPQ